MWCLSRRASEIGNLSFDILKFLKAPLGLGGGRVGGSFGITTPGDTTTQQATCFAVITEIAQRVCVAFNILLCGLCPILGGHAKDWRDRIVTFNQN